ncbi:MAG: substrate-binding domain-containing protein [Syntrophomonadaceae bacterium]|nr:substrate-binding domain-containing protein [Syntrophomonadaceae bacterium]MDD3897947.1 substrate-binding domain-containing protein [Syntrophomonadaceae bacterium]
MRKLGKNKLFALLLVMMFAVGVMAGCGNQANQEPEKTPTEQVTPTPDNPKLKLATTTSTQDSGLLDVLKPEFEKDTGYNLEIIAVGTGAAIELGKKGDVDVLLVHSRKAEDEFVAAGYGVNRKDVMYNDFLIVGPENDPAGIKGEKDIVVAMKKIVDAKATFVSRGDDSGTHKKEKSVWDKAGITPKGDWYKSVGKGMGDTFRMANELKAYTLIDRATFLSLKDKYQLVPAVEGDASLLNPYGVIAISKDKYPNTNFEGANAFIDWMVSEKGQKMIGEYGVDKYGQQLFVPDAK